MDIEKIMSESIDIVNEKMKNVFPNPAIQVPATPINSQNLLEVETMQYKYINNLVKTALEKYHKALIEDLKTQTS